MRQQSVPGCAELICVDYFVAQLLGFVQALLSLLGFFKNLWLLENCDGLPLPDLLVSYHVLLINLPEDVNCDGLSRVSGVVYGHSLH